MCMPAIIVYIGIGGKREKEMDAVFRIRLNYELFFFLWGIALYDI